MSVISSLRLSPRLRVLLPLVIALALFATPVGIWLVRRDSPSSVTERLKGRIVSVGPAAERARRVVVALGDGMTVIIRSNDVPLEAKPGDDIDLLRTKRPSGEIDYELDGQNR